MKEIKLKGLDISCYTDVLDNGLEVIMLPYENKKNYFISYATRFGSEVTKFIPNDLDEFVKVPDGIAHFLEHKMFEQEDGVDPFQYFSESGTGANASTSFDSTQYICYGTKNFEDNLRYLLTYVNQPFYTDQNVEKEKGIIAEELKMYDDIPEFVLEMKLRENIYHKSNRRIDIGGSIPEINKITKEDLYLCYNNFYSPNNMFVLIVGNFDRKKALSIVKEVVGNIDNKSKATIDEVVEPKDVRLKEETITTSIKVPKIGIGIKIATDEFKYDDLMLDLYLTMISTICFGTSSEFRERVRNDKLLNSFYTEWETIDGFRTFYIMASSNDPDKLLNEIKEELKDIVISEDAFNRMKKVWIANEVKMIDNIDATVSNMYDDLIKYKKVISDKVDCIRSMKLDDINKLVSKIDFTNMSVVKMIGKED